VEEKVDVDERKDSVANWRRESGRSLEGKMQSTDHFPSQDLGDSVDGEPAKCLRESAFRN